MKLKVLLFGAWLCSFAWPALSQLDPIDINIPMSDGALLSGHLYLPEGDGPWPVILVQTPYNKNFYALTGLPLGFGNDLSDSPYAFVITDWRCFWGSANACGGDATRGEDGYDTVEWIAQQEWCNGKVGTWGPSALGNVQFETANEQPPHLVCCAPLVPSPSTTYEIYYPGGSLRTEYIQTLSVLFGVLGGFALVVQNPYDNLVWTIAEMAGYDPANIEVPMFIVAGWYDHNTEDDLYTINRLRTQGNPAANELHKIVIGPWVHGGTGQANVGSGQQGELEYPDAAYYDTELCLQFFERYLLEVENDWEDHQPYIWYRMGGEVWNEASVWPPASIPSVDYYLRSDGEMSLTPESGSSSVQFPYDPNDPSPTIGGKTLNFALDQGPYDQRFEVEDREDAIIFTTEAFQEEMEIDGKIEVRLFVSSDKVDTDFCVRLTEVYPDDRSMLLGEAIQRMRFRNGYTQLNEEFMEPGVVYPIDLEFESLSLKMREGHSLRLVVSSSNYPRYNRNMNTGGEMYPDNNADTLVNPLTAINTVHVGGSTASYIRIPQSTIISVNEQDLGQKLSIYPVPCINHLNWNPDLKGLVHVYDSQGSLVISANNNIGSIDVNALPPGQYTITIRNSEGEIFSAQFLKQ